MADNKPRVTQDLVDYLERVFPNRCPNPVDADREIWISVGTVKVVRHIRDFLLPASQSPDDSIL